MTKNNEEPCAEFARFRRIDAAFRAGDLAALQQAVDDPAIVPNGAMPLATGPERLRRDCVAPILRTPSSSRRTTRLRAAGPEMPRDRPRSA